MATLSRAIALPHATAIVVGIIVGASVFVQASEITALVPAIPPALPREAADSASAPLTLVTPGGYKLEGLDLAGAAFLLRQLA